MTAETRFLSWRAALFALSVAGLALASHHTLAKSAPPRDAATCPAVSAAAVGICAAPLERPAG